jgi:hypothetical protein
VDGEKVFRRVWETPQLPRYQAPAAAARIGLGNLSVDAAFSNNVLARPGRRYRRNPA